MTKIKSAMNTFFMGVMYFLFICLFIDMAWMSVKWAVSIWGSLINLVVSLFA